MLYRRRGRPTRSRYLTWSAASPGHLIRLSKHHLQSVKVSFADLDLAWKHITGTGFIPEIVLGVILGGISGRIYGVGPRIIPGVSKADWQPIVRI